MNKKATLVLSLGILVAVLALLVQADSIQRAKRGGTLEIHHLPNYGAKTHHLNDEVSLTLSGVPRENIREVRYRLNQQRPVLVDLFKPVTRHAGLLIQLPGEIPNRYANGQHRLDVDVTLKDGQSLHSHALFTVDFEKPPVTLIAQSETDTDVTFRVSVGDKSYKGVGLGYHDGSVGGKLESGEYTLAKIDGARDVQLSITISKRLLLRKGKGKRPDLLFLAWDAMFNTSTLSLWNEGRGKSREKQQLSAALAMPSTGPNQDLQTCAAPVFVAYTGVTMAEGASEFYYDEWYSPESKKAQINLAFTLANFAFNFTYMSPRHTAFLSLLNHEPYFIPPSPVADATSLEIMSITMNTVPTGPFEQVGVFWPPESGPVSFLNFELYSTLKNGSLVPGGANDRMMNVFFYDGALFHAPHTTDDRYGTTAIQYLDFVNGLTGEFKPQALRHVMLHELMHQMGLGHDENNFTSIMWPVNDDNLIPMQTYLHDEQKDRAYAAICVEGFQPQNGGEWYSLDDETPPARMHACGPDAHLAAVPSGAPMEGCEVKYSDYMLPSYVRAKGNPHYADDSTPGGPHLANSINWCPYKRAEVDGSVGIIALHPGDVDDLCYVDHDQDPNTAKVYSGACRLCAPPQATLLEMEITFTGNSCTCYTRDEMIEHGIPEDKLPPDTLPPGPAGPSIPQPDTGGGKKEENNCDGLAFPPSSFAFDLRSRPAVCREYKCPKHPLLNVDQECKATWDTNPPTCRCEPVLDGGGGVEGVLEELSQDGDSN